MNTVNSEKGIIRVNSRNPRTLSVRVVRGKFLPLCAFASLREEFSNNSSHGDTESTEGCA